MARPLLSAALVCAAVGLLSAVLHAQSVEIWKDGAWTVEAPSGANCGSMPLLQVKGPGSIFDPANASALASLEKSLPGSLAKVCPGVRDAILVSGRTRRLIRLADAPATPANTPLAAAPPQPARETLPVQDQPRTGRRAEPMAPVATLAPPPPTPAGSSTAPVISGRSELRGLSAARNIEDKCEVLLGWLESGKEGAPSNPNYRVQRGTEMLAIFRDEPMMAVFGTPYDKTENRWRLEQHEKVISRCLGLVAPRPTPFNRQPNRTLQQYGQQFHQYRSLLDQAFLGQPGAFEPTRISRHVQQVRTQIEWANQAIALAAAAPPARDSFDRLTAQRQAVNSQLSLLGPVERSQVTGYLGRRQSEIAPAIAEEWFRIAGASQKGAASAKVLHSSHAGIMPVLNALDSQARSAFEDRYKNLIQSLIADPLQAEIARLNAIPSSLPGVMQISAWKTAFDASFGDLRGIPAVEAAGHEFNQARARVFSGALPFWIRQVEAIPPDGAPITAKRREMETLFPSREDRSSTVFVQYETPLKAKEDQLRLRVEAEMRKQQQEANAAALQSRVAASGTPPEQNSLQPAPKGAARSRGGPNPVLAAASFSAKGLHNEGVLTAIYLGDFTKIGFNRDDLNFSSLYGLYLKSFGSQCDAYLPPNKVEMTVQRCTAEMVTRNGYGVEISRYCSNWVTEGTGVYADPQMYDAKKQLDRLMAMDTFRNVGKMLTQRDPIGGMMNMVGTAQAAMADMEAVVRQNGCPSPGLKRFEENLMQFALNKQPTRLGEYGPKLSAIAPLPGIPFRDQNYTRLIEDLVSEHSRTWVMNRYISGSVTNVNVSSRDGQGRPTKIVAGYIYNGFSNRSQGSVTLTFTEEMPECMYFHDFPASCRTPDRKIVASYLDGAYKPQ